MHVQHLQQHVLQIVQKPSVCMLEHWLAKLCNMILPKSSTSWSQEAGLPVVLYAAQHFRRTTACLSPDLNQLCTR